VKLTAIKSKPLRAGDFTLTQFVDEYVKDLPPRSVLAITSKVVALCEGRVVKIGDIPKEELVRREADYYIPGARNRYGVIVTIKDDIFVAAAGVDESNGDGNYVLWPADSQASANELRTHLSKRFGYEVGVIITDSRVISMRRGTLGVGLAHSGFSALNNYIGTPDIFGSHDMQYTYAGVMDGLAAAAVVLMGEGTECTPMVVVEDADFVKFQDRNPTAEELALLHVPVDEDVYADMLKAMPWEKRPGKD
jgi:F420-0:gamma-glutamyl ligase